VKPYEIMKDIFIIGGPEITDSRDGCVYLIDMGELVLVDSGAGWSVEKIINNINELGLDPRKLGTILLTHCHIDHIGGAPDIRKRYGSELCIHELDAPPLENGDLILTAANWYQTAFHPAKIDRKLNSPEEILEIGGEKIICIHTPGHTPGSISIYLDKDGKRILFGQDLHGPLLEEFGSNLEDWNRSTKKLLDLEADVLCEGHFGIYKTKKEGKDYILSCRRQYAVE
jgi:glyoxylase-like metal-dependent hydrolase (beta-lactamase superfamily II)